MTDLIDEIGPFLRYVPVPTEQKGSDPRRGGGYLFERGAVAGGGDAMVAAACGPFDDGGQGA